MYKHYTQVSFFKWYSIWRKPNHCIEAVMLVQRHVVVLCVLHSSREDKRFLKLWSLGHEGCPVLSPWARAFVIIPHAESDFPCLFSNSALKCNYSSYSITCRHLQICQYYTPRGRFVIYSRLPLYNCPSVLPWTLPSPTIATIMTSAYQWNSPLYASYVLLHGLTVNLL